MRNDKLIEDKERKMERRYMMELSETILKKKSPKKGKKLKLEVSISYERVDERAGGG